MQQWTTLTTSMNVCPPFFSALFFARYKAKKMFWNGRKFEALDIDESSGIWLRRNPFQQGAMRNVYHLFAYKNDIEQVGGKAVGKCKGVRHHCWILEGGRLRVIDYIQTISRGFWAVWAVSVH